MKIKCMHGYFLFEEMRAGDVSDFINLFGLDIVAAENFFTFNLLKDAPDYSLAGSTYLGALSQVTCEGEPWDIMKENGLVYDFVNDAVVLLNQIIQPVSINQAGKYLLANGLILPGSVTEDGKRVTDYSAWFLRDSMKFKYSEVRYV